MFLSTIAGGKGEDAVLRTMFEARKRVFIDLLGWDVPVLAGRYEIDQFDDEHAAYLVLTDDRGRHLGSARLLETERPHILDTLFPMLSEFPVPRGPHIREITRFCLDPLQGASNRRITRDTLVRALADHALANGIAHYTGVAELGWLRQILRFGWECAALGMPRAIGTSVLGALQIHVTPETPALLAAAGIAPGTTVQPRAARHAA